MLVDGTSKGSPLWYVPMMRSRNTSTVSPTDARVAGSAVDGPPLSVLHAEALYELVPPVEYDADGYPAGDGRVSESTLHEEAIVYARDAVRAVLRDRADVLVASDLVLLFEEGNPRAALSPDLMVVFGVDTDPRTSYKLWREFTVPAFAMEVLSQSTSKRDLDAKPPLYAALGIGEYWLFDPFTGRLDGYRLAAGEYHSISAVHGWRRSDLLELDFGVDQETLRLRLRDPATGETLPEHVQLVRRLAKSEEKARQAETARRAAERRLEELETRLRRSRPDS